MLIYNRETLAILEINEAFTDKYGYDATSLKNQGLSIKDIRPQEDIGELMDSISTINVGGINKTGVFRHKSKDGEIFYVNITSQDIPYGEHEARLVVSHDVSRQVEAERRSAYALHELEHHIKNSPLAYVKWDRSFRVLEWSGQAEKISGYSREEVRGKNLFSIDFLTSDEEMRIKELIEDLLLGNHDKNQFQTKVKDRTGEELFVKVHSSALRDEQGQVVSVLTMIEDITEQKKSEIKYQRLFENANDSILILKDGLFSDCNKQAEALYGASRKAIIGKSPADFSPEMQPDGNASETEAYRRIERAFAEGSHMFEWQHQNTNGQLIDVEVSLNRITFPDGEYLQAIVRDITDKKETQAKLRKSEGLFRNLFLKSPAALVMVDADDNVQVSNESFEEMFGYSLNEIQGKNLDALIVPEEFRSRAPNMKSRSTSEDDFQLEGVRITKDGSYKHVLIAGMPVYIDDQPVAGLGMYLDITDRKQSEKKLKQSLEEKKVLLEEIHHRLKNNLAIISGLIQLQEFDSEDQNVKEVLNDSQLRIKSIALVHELLYQSETFSNISLNCYIHQLLDGITDTLSFDTSDISVSVDVDEKASININQAIPCALLINELVTNAYKHAFGKGEAGEIRIGLSREGEQIQVMVSDNGSGLPDGFNLSESKSLGLSLINTLSSQLNAVLEYDGSNGAAFYLYFTPQKAGEGGSVPVG